MYLNKDFPIIKVSVAFIAGLLLSPILKTNFLIYLIFSVVLITFLILFNLYNKSTKHFISDLVLIVIIVLLGSFYSALSNLNSQSLLGDYQKEKNVVLYSTVKDIELERDYEINFISEIDSIFIDSKKIISKELLICRFRGDSSQRKSLYTSLNPGNKVYLTGTYAKGRDKRNPGEFDYDKYLSQKGIQGLITSYSSDSIRIIDPEKELFPSVVFSVRKYIDQSIHQLHNKTTSGLLRGLLLADRSEIDYETKSNFVNAGVIHILAVSGLHVGYVLVIFIFIFGRFNLYTRSILTIAGLLCFMFITGVPASVFRATLMAIILIVAFLTNRTTNLINSIAFAALLILIVSPNEIYNPGFQLSFAAVLSIAIIYPKIQNIIYKAKIKTKWLRAVLLFAGVSISAQIGTIPFTLAYFNKLSIISLFTNLIVIPVIGIIVAIAIFTLFIAIIFQPIAIFFALTNNFISNFIIWFIQLSGSLSFSFLWIRNYSLIDGLVFYILIAYTLLFFYRIKNVKAKIIFFLLVTINLFLFSSLDNRKLFQQGDLNLLMIDVGQGDSFLLQFPNGKTTLIDAGEVNPFFDNGERVIIPLLDHLGIDKIDYGFITHLDLDHYGGFASLIYNNKIKEIYRPAPDSSDKSIRLEKFLSNKQIIKKTFNKVKLEIGNATVYIMNDPSSNWFKSLSGNDKSGFIKIVYGNTSIIFTGDAEFSAEAFYISRYGKFLDSDILKVGHHGSKTSSMNDFVSFVSPKYSLISAGLKNKFEHPHNEVLSTLEKSGSEILRTDELGAVLIQSDGNNIKIINWK